MLREKQQREKAVDKTVMPCAMLVTSQVVRCCRLVPCSEEGSGQAHSTISPSCVLSAERSGLFVSQDPTFYR